MVLESVSVLGVKGHERVVYMFPCVCFIYLLIKWFSGVFPNTKEYIKTTEDKKKKKKIFFYNLMCYNQQI